MLPCSVFEYLILIIVKGVTDTSLPTVGPFFFKQIKYLAIRTGGYQSICGIFFGYSRWSPEDYGLFVVGELTLQAPPRKPIEEGNECYG
jgi:hypothetical protein